MKPGDRVRVTGGAHDGKAATVVFLNGSCAMCRFFRPVQRRSGNWSEQTWVAKRQLEFVAKNRDLAESAA